MRNGTICFLRKDEKTLFLYRNKDKGEEDLHRGWYIPPGGQTERGERGIDCIIREFEEETGLILISPKLRIIATFYNEGRTLGGKENPEDWCVEVYEARDYKGVLKEEHSKAKPIWINNADFSKVKIYPGDRKMLDLLDQEGIFEVITQYSKEKLIRFESQRVA